MKVIRRGPLRKARHEIARFVITATLAAVAVVALGSVAPYAGASVACAAVVALRVSPLAPLCRVACPDACGGNPDVQDTDAPSVILRSDNRP